MRLAWLVSYSIYVRRGVKKKTRRGDVNEMRDEWHHKHKLLRLKKNLPQNCIDSSD